MESSRQLARAYAGSISSLIELIAMDNFDVDNGSMKTGPRENWS